MPYVVWLRTKGLQNLACTMGPYLVIPVAGTGASATAAVGFSVPLVSIIWSGISGKFHEWLRDGRGPSAILDQIEDSGFLGICTWVLGVGIYCRSLIVITSTFCSPILNIAIVSHTSNIPQHGMGSTWAYASSQYHGLLPSGDAEVSFRTAALRHVVPACSMIHVARCRKPSPFRTFRCASASSHSLQSES